jgi:hypothetical protein
MSKRYIYYLWDEWEYEIKIGVTFRPKRRIQEIGRGQLIGIHYGSMGTEKSLHKLFDEYRIHGEWFSENDKIIKHIAKVDTWSIIKPRLKWYSFANTQRQLYLLYLNNGWANHELIDLRTWMIAFRNRDIPCLMSAEYVSYIPYSK